MAPQTRAELHMEQQLNELSNSLKVMMAESEKRITDCILMKCDSIENSMKKYITETLAESVTSIPPFWTTIPGRTVPPPPPPE